MVTRIFDAAGYLVGSIIMVSTLLMVMSIMPMLTLWSINSLAEMSNTEFYIPHSPLSYFFTFILIAIIRMRIPVHENT